MRSARARWERRTSITLVARVRGCVVSLRDDWVEADAQIAAEDPGYRPWSWRVTADGGRRLLGAGTARTERAAKRAALACVAAKTGGRDA